METRRMLRISFRDAARKPALLPVPDDYEIKFNERGWIVGPGFTINSIDVGSALIVQEEETTTLRAAV